jgi:hypothetical protein
MVPEALAGGANKTTELQAVLDTASSFATHRKIVFPRGTYASTDLYVKANTTIEGAGRGATILPALGNDTTQGSRIHIENVDNVTLRGFTVTEMNVLRRVASAAPSPASTRTGSQSRTSKSVRPVALECTSPTATR